MTVDGNISIFGTLSKIPLTDNLSNLNTNINNLAKNYYDANAVIGINLYTSRSTPNGGTINIGSRLI